MDCMSEHWLAYRDDVYEDPDLPDADSQDSVHEPCQDGDVAEPADPPAQKSEGSVQPHEVKLDDPKADPHVEDLLLRRKAIMHLGFDLKKLTLFHEAAP